MRKYLGNQAGGMPGGTRLSGVASSIFQDHLGLDAVVAYADGALSLTAFQRAAAHVSHCADCAREVDEQTAVRRQLRAAADPPIPTGLMNSLLSIPLALPLPAAGDGSRDARGGGRH